MRLSVRIIIVSVLFVLALPAGAVKIVPGVYKLKWETRREWSDPLWRRWRQEQCPTYLHSLPERIPGVVSKRAVWNSPWTDNYTLIIDESKGTGKGYDIAYVGGPGPEYDNFGHLLVKRLVKVPLTKRGNALVAEGYAAKPPWPYGSRQRVFDITAWFNGTERRDQPASAKVYVRGAWYGKIKTDQGPLDVRLAENGPLGEWGTVIFGWADALSRDFSGASITELSIVSPTVTFDSRLYSMSLSDSGDTLTVKPFTGPAGTLVVNAIDGYGRPVKWCSVWMSSMHFTVDYAVSGRQALNVPVGPYEEISSTLLVTQGESRLYVNSVLPKPVIRAGKTMRLTVGGPLTITLAVEKSGDGRRIVCKPHLPPPQQCREVPMGAKLALALRDARGQVVHTASSEPGSPNGFELPKTLKPGNYTALVTIDLRPYDRKKVFGASLRLE